MPPPWGGTKEETPSRPSRPSAIHHRIKPFGEKTILTCNDGKAGPYHVTSPPKHIKHHALPAPGQAAGGFSMRNRCRGKECHVYHREISPSALLHTTELATGRTEYRKIESRLGKELDDWMQQQGDLKEDENLMIPRMLVTTFLALVLVSANGKENKHEDTFSIKGKYAL